jgi:hypothetical protein
MNQKVIFSPASLFELIYMLITETSYSDYFRYYDQAVKYRGDFVNYLEKKNAFLSSKWFTPEEIPFDKYHPAYPKNIESITKDDMIRMMNYRKIIETNVLTLDDFPIYQFHFKSISTIFNEISIYLVCVIIYISCFILLLIFIKKPNFLI